MGSTLKHHLCLSYNSSPNSTLDSSRNRSNQRSISTDLKTFQQLTASYNLPSKDFYFYLRIRHICSSIPIPNGVVSIVTTFLYSVTTNSKGISYIYNLSCPNSTHKYGLLGIELTNLGTPCWMVTSSQNSIPFLPKCHSMGNSWKYTISGALRLQNSSRFSKCWRNCNTDGTIFHIWWECAVLSPLFEEHFFVNIWNYPSFTFVNPANGSLV